MPALFSMNLPLFEATRHILPSLASGFGLTAGLIVAIGAQNAFVLKQGVQGRHIGPVVLLCCVYDIALIVCGLAGMGTVILAHPALVDTVRYLGAAMLAVYGLRSWLAAWRGTSALSMQAVPESLPQAAPPYWSAPVCAATGAAGAVSARQAVIRRAGRHESPSGSLRAVLLSVTLLTLLNPHVYLDTVVLLGGVGGTLPWPERGWFGAGAMVASCVWFVLLGYGARRLSGWFARPVAWRALDAMIGCVMFIIAASLLMAHF
ncbi:LysE/ArgO family amino acid transporter [Robbsia andropogonis]